MKVIGVIRSIGERTEDFSKFLLEKQVDEIYLVKNVKPMVNMTLMCLKIGVNSKADYMITCDSDVFILPNMVNFMVGEIKKHKRPLITGHTKSKFLGKRQGGIRIWNVSNMKEMINLLEKNDDFDKYRPEAYIHSKIKGLLINDVTSYHEYEQYYKDIYEKFINQSIKTKSKSSYIKGFKKHKDIDFRVAYHGYFDKEKDFRKSFPDLVEKDMLNISEIKNKYLKL